MIERRYALVIMDSSGKATRRVSVSLTALRVLAFAGVMLGCMGAGMVVHGVTNHQLALEAAEVGRQNEDLHKLLDYAWPMLHQARRRAFHADLHSWQTLAKSGLGIAREHIYGIGPVGSGGVDGESSELALSDAPSPLLTRAHTERAFERVLRKSSQTEAELAGLHDYFRDAEQLLQSTPSRRPVRSSSINSGFGKRRHPMTGGWVMHKGVDMPGYIGMPVIAPADGVVIWTGTRGGYGLTIVLDHGYVLQTHYAHLSRYQVAPGDRVLRGDVIGDMGNSGRSTGPHLHYEVRRHGHPLNPRPFILD